MRSNYMVGLLLVTNLMLVASDDSIRSIYEEGLVGKDHITFGQDNQQPQNFVLVTDQDILDIIAKTMNTENIGLDDITVALVQELLRDTKIFLYEISQEIAYLQSNELSSNRDEIQFLSKQYRDAENDIETMHNWLAKNR